MNLNGRVLLATLGEQVGVDFWSYQWPYEQIETYNPEELVPCLLRAAAHYRDARYRAFSDKADIARPVTSLLLRLTPVK